MMRFICGIVWLLLMQGSTFVSGERTRDKMYSSIAGASCFRRLNGTHQTGCSSPFSGSVGVLHLIKTAEDFDFIVNKPPAPPYAPIIPPHLFTRENILRLKNDAAKYVSAIVLINRTNKLTNFSHELNCPNQFSGITEQTCDQSKPESTWNPYGTGLLHEEFPFPIYYVANTEEIDKIEKCFEKFNNFDFPNQKDRSLCSIQVNAFMSAAVNAEVCIRRTSVVNNLTPTRFCDPLQGRNIYTTLFPRRIVDSAHRTVNQSEKFILVSARLDTATFFDGIGLGAMDSLISFATLVNLAHYLATILPESPKNAKRNVLFMIFNGESYDYIGSQRFVYDLQTKAFPSKLTSTDLISFGNIELMIDIGTLDDLSDIKLYYAKEFELKNKFYTSLNAYEQKFNLGFNISKQQTLNLPPTSAQSFLRESLTFPVVIINSKAENKFYHSIYDDFVNINYKYYNTSEDFTKLDQYTTTGHFASNSTQIKIRNAASAIALSIYDLITESTYTGDEIASSVLVDEFLYCFLQSAECPLFKAASPQNSLPGLPVPPLRYISVHGASQEASGWTSRLLGYLVGEKLPNIAKDNCTELPLHWFSGFNGTGECRYTKHNYSLAYSPAFTVDDYDWKSGKYSTWTESTWTQINARIFLKPSRSHEALTLAIGLVVMIIAFIAVFLINSRSDVLFGTCPLTSPITEPAAC